MEIEGFLKSFADAVDVDESVISPRTVYKDADGWDSLAALTVIAMTDELYEFTLSGDDLMNCSTVGDLWQLIAGQGEK